MISAQIEEEAPYKEFIKLLIDITTFDNEDNPLCKYSNISSNDPLSEPNFRNDLHKMLQRASNIYSANEFYEAKYIITLNALIFGVSQGSIVSSSSCIKKRKQNENNITNVQLNNESFVAYYKDQNEKIIELSLIILHTIQNIQSIYDAESIEDIREEIESLFESEIKEYFLKHFCLFSESVHKLMEMLYDVMELESTDSREYVLMMEIVIENKDNYDMIVISKFDKLIERLRCNDSNEINLLSLNEKIDFSNEFEIHKTTQRLKAFNYLKQQKMKNSSLIEYDNIKYINIHFLYKKYQVTVEQYEKIYNIKEYKENLQKKKLSNNEEIKESLKEENQKIKNDINTLNMHYIKDMNLIKLAVAQTQNHYNTTHKQLNDKITHLELQIEKINSI